MWFGRTCLYLGGKATIPRPVGESSARHRSDLQLLRDAGRLRHLWRTPSEFLLWHGNGEREERFARLGNVDPRVGVSSLRSA